MGHKISKEQIDPGVKDHIMSFVGNIADLETEVNTDIISAVNSLMVDRVDNAENMGKLANAIGEPVTANHSVDEVVEGLGEMLSTFKTNMMNSGVMVESSDKFKQLIDKIKGLTEGEGNKGIQLASGIAVGNKQVISGWHLYGIEIQDLNFTPCLIYAYDDKTDVACLSNLSGSIINNYRCYVEGSIGNHTASYDELMFDNGFKIIMSSHPYTTNVNWWAIGVGEEDTTLRDSLASILQEEGVSVTEEDTMASLITKVDEEFDNIKNKYCSVDIQAGDNMTIMSFITSDAISISSTSLEPLISINVSDIFDSIKHTNFISFRLIATGEGISSDISTSNYLCLKLALYDKDGVLKSSSNESSVSITNKNKWANVNVSFDFTDIEETDVVKVLGRFYYHWDSVPYPLSMKLTNANIKIQPIIY